MPPVAPVVSPQLRNKAFPLAKVLLTFATVKLRQVNRIMRSSFTGGLLTAVLISLVLFAFGLSASNELHKDFHPGADGSQHECIVTLLTNGGVELAGTHTPTPHTEDFIVRPSFSPFVVFAPLDHRLPPGRAPPLSFS